MKSKDNVKVAHSAMLEVVHNLSAQQRSIIFRSSPLSNDNSEPLTTSLDFCKVAEKSKVADVAAQLSYAKAICRLLEYMFADTVPVEMHEDELVSSRSDLCA